MRKDLSITQIEIELVDIDSLKPDASNPRTITEFQLDALTGSIEEFGFVDPVIARTDSRTVIGGHQRLIAARRLGIRQIPTVFVDLDDEQAKLLNLALNRIDGEFDQELLSRLLADIEFANPDVDLAVTGFEEDELATILSTLDTREKRERVESFDFAEALEESRVSSRTSIGDIWILGDHRLMCGDSTNAELVQQFLRRSPPDMTFTDPPYGVDYESGPTDRRNRASKIKNDALVGDEWKTFVSRWAETILENTSGAIYVFMSGKEFPIVCDLMSSAGGHWSTTIVWAKDRFTLGRSDYQRAYELVWFGWKEGNDHYWCGDRNQSDLWKFDRPSSSPLHPTMKPLDLVELAIENSSQVGNVVFDPFAGSGTTLIACERTGRKAMCIELDPNYVDAIIARWESFTGIAAVKEQS